MNAKNKVLFFYLTLFFISFYIDIVVFKDYIFTFFILPICMTFNLVQLFLYKKRQNFNNFLRFFIITTVLFTVAQIHEHLLMIGISQLATDIERVKIKDGKYPPSNLSIRIWEYQVNYINTNKTYEYPFIYFRKNGGKTQTYNLNTHTFLEEKYD